jgi:cytochrome c-type biogenesis protein CcsB
MSSSELLGATTFIYLTATVIYVAAFLFQARKAGFIATLITITGLLANTAGIGMRWLESHRMGIGYAPLSNMYESLVFFALSIAVFYLVLEFIYKNRNLGAFIIPFAFLSMAYASFSTEFGKEIKPLLPALQSNWLIAHVISCFIGYAAFTVACGLGCLYLIKSRKEKSKKNREQSGIFNTLPRLKEIDIIIHKSLLFGFLWLSTGIITGAVWANSAWGTYWSWDPKETWSLITWFIYASALHARFTRGWGGRRIAWLSIAGFAAVLFTYYGVNFLLAGLHSYGS